MERIRVFISYSSAQKEIGGTFKRCLISYSGYEAFIAHDDIEGARIFEDEIIIAINNCDFFIPLISEEFKQSAFTDQETGIAVASKKLIIPIKLSNINPYGFIGKYHALQFKKNPPNYHFSNNISELASSISRIGISYKSPKIHKRALDSLVYAFINSSSFDISNATIQTLCKCTDLDKNHITQITNAIKTNPQIKNAFGLEDLKNCLLKNYNIAIDSYH